MTNLLCVSDEWSLGFDELRELSNAGFRVIEAPTGFDAVKEFATQQVDAVVLNRRLPDISVREIAIYFRRHNVSTPIVMVSTIMPIPDAPATVDAVIHKNECAALLVPTLQVLMSARMKQPASGDESMVQAA
jgi:CheY-like chemotaxis protein